MANELKGKVHEVGPVQQVSADFTKRDLIVLDDSNPTYPEYIRFETIKDKTKLLDELRPGDEVTVHYNVKGRPWTNKEGVTSYFNSLVAWKIDINKTTAGQSQAQQQQTTFAPPPASKPEDLEDDLPF